MNKSIYDVSSGIDFEYVEEAENIKKSPVSFKKKLLKIGSICASLLIVVVSAIVIIPMLTDKMTPENDANIGFMEQEITKTPWVERPIYDKFESVTFNEVCYFSTDSAVDENKIKESLGIANAHSYDDAGKARQIAIEIFSISNISINDSIAIKFDDIDGFYIYKSSTFISENLDDPSNIYFEIQDPQRIDL